MSDDRWPDAQFGLRSGTDSERDTASSPAAPRRGLRWLLLLILVLVVAVVLTVYAPREISRWYIAAAQEQLLDKDLEAAEQLLGKAIEWDSDSSHPYLERSQLRLLRKNIPGALEDAQQAVQFAPGDRQALIQRATVYQHADQHERAVDDWKQILKQTDPRRLDELASALNGLAYAQALSGQEIQEGLAHSERSIETISKLRQITPFTRAALLDTRGYLYLLDGQLEKARDDLDRAVKLAEEQYAALTDNPDSVIAATGDERIMRKALDEIAHNVAVLRYHRSLVYDRLELADEAEADRRRVRELGYEPGDDLF